MGQKMASENAPVASASASASAASAPAAAADCPNPNNDGRASATRMAGRNGGVDSSGTGGGGGGGGNRMNRHRLFRRLGGGRRGFRGGGDEDGDGDGDEDGLESVEELEASIRSDLESVEATLRNVVGGASSSALSEGGVVVVGGGGDDGSGGSRSYPFATFAGRPSSSSSSSSSGLPSSGAFAVGRAAYSSVASTLENVRDRLAAVMEGTADGSTEEGAAEARRGGADGASSASAAAAASSSLSSAASSSLRQLSERLRRAEAAHSRRVPLGLLDEVERRTSRAGGRSSESSSGSSPSGTTTGTSAVENGDGDGDGDGNGNGDGGGDAERGGGGGGGSKRDGRAKDDSDDGDSGDRAKLRRDSSVLLASRRLADAASRANAELHRGAMAGLPDLISIDEVPGAIEATIPHTIQDLDDDKDKSRRLEESLTCEQKERGSGGNDDDENNDSGNCTNVDGDNDDCGNGGTSDLSLPPPDAPATPSHPGQTILYSWGSGSSGALLHDDTSGRPAPSSSSSQSDPDRAKIDPSSRLGRRAVLTIGSSLSHTACSTSSGEVFGCGDNAEGAVDPYRCGDEPGGGHILPRPVLIECLPPSTRVVQVSCGLDHTAAVSGGGAVLTWGSNVYGQLGHRSGFPAASPSTSLSDNMAETATSPPIAARRRRPPAAMALGAGRRAASVACGGYFTIVLTDRMWVVASGADAGGGGDLDDGPPVAQLQPPSPIPALEGLPIVSVSAGTRHAVAVTALGVAYAWGGNAFGCCGREVPTSGLLDVPGPIRVPPPPKPPRGGSRAGSRRGGEGGEDCGAGPSGMKVSDDESNHTGTTTMAAPAPAELRPPDEVAIASAACGGEHTVLVTRSGRLLVCGRNDRGQLGIGPNDDDGERGGACDSVCPVRPLLHPDEARGRRFKSAAAGADHTLLLDDRGDVFQMGGGIIGGSDGGAKRVLAGKAIVSIAAGGGQSFAVAAGPGPGLGGLRRQFSVQADTAVTKDGGMFPAERIRSLADAVSRESDAVYGDAEDGSGVGEGGAKSPPGRGEELPPGTAGRDLARRTEDLLRSPAVLNGLFADPAELDEFYARVTTLGPDRVRRAVVTAVERGVRQGLEVLQRGGARFFYPESVRCLLMYLQCPLFGDCKEDAILAELASDFDFRGEVFLSLCELILSLPFEGYRALISWALSLYPRELFVGRLVRNLLSHLHSGLPAAGVGATPTQRRSVPAAVAVLRWLHGASERSGDFDPADFYSDAVSTLPIEELYEDMRRYKAASKSQRASHFFLCAHPFLLTATAKRNLLQMDNQMEMVKAATAGLSYDVQQRAFVFDPYFVLAVDRKYLLQQTLQKVEAAAPGELRKQLKVVFKGEDGVDAGGVTKEFFQLLVANLFDVNTGMWKEGAADDGQVHWFNGDCTWNQDGFYLVGVLVGLALYNGVLLDVHFPKAVYRKLLRLPLGLEDVVDAATRNGLRQLLEYDGDDVESVFCLTFDVAWMDFGQERSVELKPGGRDIPVTNRNREEYVILYVKWLLVDSVQEQYRAFEAGFMRVMEASCLDLLRPEELELLVVGTPDLDFGALEKNTEYEGGIDANSDVVRNFWRFAKTSDAETQVRLLKFCTGTARAPIGGLGAMPFKLQKAGSDSMQLPTSHTCFNTLLLPDYGDNYEKLSDRLGRAIMECEGFGLQ